jgi:uncharacterized protein involved in exopolysaccharide biosynthesis
MQFDPRFETVENLEPNYGAYPEVALSVDVLQTVLQRVHQPPDGPISVQDFRDTLSTESGNDPSLVYLKVRSISSIWATEVANVWAEEFVQTANELYGGGANELQFVTSQFEVAQAELGAAESALVAFEARNQAATLNNRLGVLRETQRQYLIDVRDVDALSQDITRLREHYSERPERVVTPGDRLTILLLQMKVFDAQESVPLQLDIQDEGALLQASVTEYLRLLDELLSTLDVKENTIVNQLSGLAPKILELQQQLSEVESEKARLTRRKEMAEETYLTLARKYEEVRIAVGDETDEVKLVSRSVLPEKPIGPGEVVYTLLGGMLGTGAMILSILVLTSWREIASSRAEGARRVSFTKN